MVAIEYKISIVERKKVSYVQNKLKNFFPRMQRKWENMKTESTEEMLGVPEEETRTKAVAEKKL